MMAAVLTLVLLAAPSEAVSRAHFGKAQKAFAQHDWRRALDEFTAADESAPSELPDLWFDIAQCHRNLGHARQAAAAFTRYLELAPDAPDRDKVRALVVSLGALSTAPVNSSSARRQSCCANAFCALTKCARDTASDGAARSTMVSTAAIMARTDP